MFKKNEPIKKPDSASGKAPDRSNDPGFNRSNAAGASPSSGSASRKPIKSSPQGPRAVIGSSVSIKGEIHSDEEVSVYGKIEGSIVLPDSHLLVGNTGKINANIQVKSIDVEGQLKGEVSATERITIRKSGNVNGNISSPRVMLEDGCRFEGNIAMRNDAKRQTAKQTAAQPNASPPSSS